MHPRREIVNALAYWVRAGCAWRLLPYDLPPYGAVYYYFAKWRGDGTDQLIHDVVRWQVREKAGRAGDPTAVVIDSQTVRRRRTCLPRRPVWMLGRSP